jgi:hypothetical protein
MSSEKSLFDELSAYDLMLSCTNFSQQDQTWAEFQTSKVAIGTLRIYGVID